MLCYLETVSHCLNRVFLTHRPVVTTLTSATTITTAQSAALSLAPKLARLAPILALVPFYS